MDLLLPDEDLKWPLPFTVVSFIAQKEGCRLSAYLCPAGVWTCGWGETDGVTANTQWTQEYADQRFCDSLTERVETVRALCTRTPTPMQLGAMVSLSYNIGVDGFKKSTVLRQHNAGNFAAAARAFALWNKITDPKTKQLVESGGLTNRRRAEAVMYATQPETLGGTPMPQEVAPESKLTDSPIAKSGAVTAGLGLLTVFKDQADIASGLMSSIGQIAGQLHIAPATLLGGVLLVVGGVAIYQRWKQRQGGWA